MSEEFLTLHCIVDVFISMYRFQIHHILKGQEEFWFLKDSISSFLGPSIWSSIGTNYLLTSISGYHQMVHCILYIKAKFIQTRPLRNPLKNLERFLSPWTKFDSGDRRQLYTNTSIKTDKDLLDRQTEIQQGSRKQKYM